MAEILQDLYGQTVVPFAYVGLSLIALAAATVLPLHSEVALIGLLSVGIATVGTWGRLKRRQGDVRPAKQGKPKGSVLDAHEEFILGALRSKPDMTLDEMVERLAAERDVRVVRTAVWKFLDRHGQTHKKRLRTPVSKSVPM